MPEFSVAQVLEALSAHGVVSKFHVNYCGNKIIDLPENNQLRWGARNCSPVGEHFWFLSPGTSSTSFTAKFNYEGSLPPEADVSELAAQVVKALAQLKVDLDSFVEASTPGRPWSVVTTGHYDDYAVEVSTFDDQDKARQEAKDRGGAYIVRGTQMWNKRLGIIEESEKDARVIWVSDRGGSVEAVSFSTRRLNR